MYVHIYVYAYNCVWLYARMIRALCYIISCYSTTWHNTLRYVSYYIRGELLVAAVRDGVAEPVDDGAALPRDAGYSLQGGAVGGGCSGWG